MNKLTDNQINLVCALIVLIAIVSFFAFATYVDMNTNNWYNFKK